MKTMRKIIKQTGFSQERGILLLTFLCLALLLSACGGNATPLPTYEPNPDEVDLGYWEETFPVVYADWAASVHGEAYLAGDTNAPTCNDCHEAPVDGEEVRTAELHLSTPARCARCHDNADLMADYEVPTDVYETYLADFHGVTINYYAQTDLTAIRDEAVCSDCHGSHAIYPADNELSSVSDANLQATCANCHAGAPEAFTSAYGHYRPVQTPASSSADSTVVFIVKLLYQALIPIVLGGMLLYIALDIFFRIKRKKTAKAVIEAQTKDETNPEHEVQS